MQKVVSIRMDEEVHHNLKVICLLEGRTMGDVIEGFVNDRVKVLKRAGRSIELIEKESSEASVESPVDESVAEESIKSVQVMNDRRKKKNKKRRR
ncbi:MAG TPA: hypothetical protein V6C97_27050 [Oculatellaceae cyanobacterium]